MTESVVKIWKNGIIDEDLLFKITSLKKNSIWFKKYLYLVLSKSIFLIKNVDTYTLC